MDPRKQKTGGGVSLGSISKSIPICQIHKKKMNGGRACVQATKQKNPERIGMHWHDHATIPIFQPGASEGAQGRKRMHQYVH